jgi:hypothetical protein
MGLRKVELAAIAAIQPCDPAVGHDWRVGKRPLSLTQHPAAAYILLRLCDDSCPLKWEPLRGEGPVAVPVRHPRRRKGGTTRSFQE